MGEKPPPKRGAGGKASKFRLFFCAYIGGCRGISAPFILPTQNPWFPLWSPPVVPLDCWVVLRDYLVLIYLVLWFFTLFWVIFYVKTTKIEMELSHTFTAGTGKLECSNMWVYKTGPKVIPCLVLFLFLFRSSSSIFFYCFYT